MLPGLVKRTNFPQADTTINDAEGYDQLAVVGHRYRFRTLMGPRIRMSSSRKSMVVSS